MTTISNKHERACIKNALTTADSLMHSQATAKLCPYWATSLGEYENTQFPYTHINLRIFINDLDNLQAYLTFLTGPMSGCAV